jgi:RNA polymerase sigma factor (sigma-70 family)
MRQILVNYAEKQRAAKRGGGEEDLPLDDVVLATEGVAEEVLALHQALEALQQEKPRWGQVVECRFFGGMTVEETAEALEISEGAVMVRLHRARLKLRELLSGYLVEQGVDEDAIDGSNGGRNFG